MGLDILIIYTSLFFVFNEGVGYMKTIVNAEIEDKYIFGWVNPLFVESAIDGVFAAADGFVLIVNDGPSSGCAAFPKIAREARNSGDYDNDAERAVFVVSILDGFDDGRANGVLNWFLLITCSGNCKRVSSVSNMSKL